MENKYARADFHMEKTITLNDLIERLNNLRAQYGGEISVRVNTTYDQGMSAMAITEVKYDEYEDSQKGTVRYVGIDA